MSVFFIHQPRISIMTNRTQLIDNRILKQGDGGPYRIGSFFSKQQVGQNSPVDKLPMPYQMSLSASNSPEISVLYVYPPQYGRDPQVVSATSMESYGFGASYEVSPWDTDDEYKLLAKLTAKIRDHQFNLAVFGAEARDSLDMISDSALRIASAIRYVRRGDLTRAARSLRAKKPGKVYKDVGNNWLELQYGWLPLLSDAYSAGEAVASILNKPQRTEFRQQRRKMGRVIPTLAHNTGSVFIQKQVIARMIEDYSPLSSLGLDDPLTVAWELLPYSFVADWFLPIGDFLEYRHVIGATKATFVVTETTKALIQGGDGGVTSDGIFVGISGGDGYTVARVDMVRKVQSSYDVPLPSFQNPLDLSWRRAASAIALVGQRFK